MPQELPKIACSLLKESGEASLQELMQAAEEVSRKALGSGWYSREGCPSTMPAGVNLQAAYPELRRIQLDTPEGLIAGLGYALTRPDTCFSSTRPVRLKNALVWPGCTNGALCFRQVQG